MTQQFFITGTSTDVGKTYCSVKLLEQETSEGKSTLGIKPIASGAANTAEGLRNDDAEKLRHASTIQLPYEQHNPLCFEPAIAPHIAAQGTSEALTVANTLATLKPALKAQADYKLIEGAGGWLVPLNETQTFADLAKALNWPIILVVKMELGCINHTLLTVESIKHHGCELAGWIANTFSQPMPELPANLTTLTQRLGSQPLLMV